MLKQSVVFKLLIYVESDNYIRKENVNPKFTKTNSGHRELIVTVN